MPEPSFAADVTRAARVIARLEVRLRRQRGHVAALENELREAKRQLRLLAQSTEPYTQPTTEETRAAADAADGV